MSYTYYVKPIAGRPKICSGYRAVNPETAADPTVEVYYAGIGYFRLTEEQAREWQYCSASDGSMRSVVQEEI